MENELCFTSKDIIRLIKGRWSRFYRLDLMEFDTLIDKITPRYRFRLNDENFYLTMRENDGLRFEIENSELVIIKYNNDEYILKMKYEILEYKVYLFKLK